MIDKAQQRAICHVRGPCLAIAGPGAGKTYTLVTVVSSDKPFSASATATVNGATAQAERVWDDYNFRITAEMPVAAAPTADEVQILISIVEKVDLSKVKISLTTDKGTTETTFSPDKTCTRGQIVTFLYRCYAAGNQA